VSSALSELRRVGRTFHTPSEAAPGCIWLMLQLAGTASGRRPYTCGPGYVYHQAHGPGQSIRQQVADVENRFFANFGGD
jgi:hypothetical protein